MKLLACLLALSLAACGSAIVTVDDASLDVANDTADSAPEACAVACNNMCLHCSGGCCIGGERDAGR